MIPPNLSIIREKCREFMANFREHQNEHLPVQLQHDSAWKESEQRISEVATGILGILKDVWNNPAFSPDFVDSINEGTYVANVVLPSIRAALTNLPLGKNGFISTSERQSMASSDRKGNGHVGRRPDIMFEYKCHEKIYELMYVECSRLSCTKRKEADDCVKLWREANDGLYWARKSCKPKKEQFGIIGAQVAGRNFYLNIITRGDDDIHRYYHLHSSEIPVHPTEEMTVSNFVKSLLILRNIIIVNMSLLYHAPASMSRRQESSSTISSPMNN